MKKYLFLYCGSATITQEMMDAWSNWFESIGDKIADGGSPLGPGREISRTGTNDLPRDKEAISGYSLINAENIEEAEKIAEGSPMITSVKVFEAMSM